VQKISLLNLVEGISSWAELEALITALPSEQERGEAFEEFCKAFFLLDPVFQFEKVYRQNEIPPSLRQKLGYPGVQDIGIDGLAVTTDGKLIAYQAKFRSDRNNIPTLRELSTFFTISDKADWRITITNTNSLPTAINNRTNQSRILVDRFDQVDSNFFDRLRFYLKEHRIEPQKKKTPHQTQKEALKSALSYFKKHNRGQLILPCGTGKTLASMWIAEKIGGSHILVMVPSLALMSQTLREWAANTVLKPFRYLCLCSDTTVDLGNDSPIEHLYEMDIPVTTDVKVVSDFLSSKQPATSILFSTYQSSKVLSKAVLKTGTILDVGIFDEAHRTTGTKVGVWNLALNDKNVPIKKRIFMTATPRIYAPHIVKKAKEEDILICSMDDSDIYGKTFYEMTFGEAIERNHISDYKIVVICVTDTEVEEIIQHGGRVITDDEHEWDAKAFAKRVALVKGINAYGLKKVFTFHSRVKGAKAFTDTDTLYGINQVFRMLETKHTEKDNNFLIPSQKHSSEVSLRGAEATKQSHNLLKNTEIATHPLGARNDKSESSDNIKFFHVNGTMPSGMRNSLMKEFKESDIGIMSNARCLTEGVDVPVVDTVAFIDPKRSLIDIVQATGRAMRKAEWKERGYIFIPVIVEENTDPEEIIKSSDFNAVWQVLQAMVDQDQRIEDIVSNLRIMQGKGEEGTEEWKDAMAEYAEKIEFYNLPIKIDKTRFINTLYTKTLEVIGKKWDFWYGLTLRYKEQNNGNPNVPFKYITPDGFKLRAWQSTQRELFKDGKLNQKKIQKLENIGFQWYLYRYSGMDKFEEGYQETLRYKEQFGDANAPANYKTPEGYWLGKWQVDRRRSFRKKKLSAERIRRLEEIGFRWNILLDRHDGMDPFKKGYQETLKYKEQFGDANAPTKYKTPEGYQLGRWQDTQRSIYKGLEIGGKLDAEKIKRLEEIGFKWHKQKRWKYLLNKS
jgi:predicted helicase